MTELDELKKLQYEKDVASAEAPYQDPNTLEWIDPKTGKVILDDQLDEVMADLHAELGHGKQHTKALVKARKRLEALIDKRILDAEIEVLESILDFQPAVEGRFRRTIEDRLFRLTALSDKHSSKDQDERSL